MGYCERGLQQIKTTQTLQVQMIHLSSHDNGSAPSGSAMTHGMHANTRTDPLHNQKPELTGNCVAQCTTSEPVLESRSTTSSLITRESHFFLYSVSNWGKGERKGKVLNIARRGFALVFVLCERTHKHTHTRAPKDSKHAGCARALNTRASWQEHTTNASHRDQR